jgi:hypothetical protein
MTLAAHARLGLLEIHHPQQVWIVHSREGVTALAWPIDPINSEAAPEAPGAAADHPKEIHS